MLKKVFRYSPDDSKTIIPKIMAFLTLLIQSCATIRIDHEFFDHGVVDVKVRYYIVSDTIPVELWTQIDTFE